MNEINNEKLNSGIKEIKNIKMTSEEKENILHSILNSPIQKRESIKSHWMDFTLISSRLPYTAIVICLVLIITGGTFYNSQKNKTGNTLSITRTDTKKQMNSPNISPENANLQNKNVAENTNIASPTKNPTLAILNESNKNEAVGSKSISSKDYEDTIVSSVRTSTTMMSINPTNPVTIISPNGGESFNKGDKITAKWQIISPSNIKFNLIKPDGTKLENQYINNNWNNIQNTSETILVIPKDIPSGQYKLSITTETEIKDISDNYFTVE